MNDTTASRDNAFASVQRALRKERAGGKLAASPLESKVDANTKLLRDIQRLHRQTKTRVDRMSTLLGNSTTVIGLKRSPLGHFISGELKKNLSSLNANGMGLAGFGKGPFVGGKGPGSFVSNLKELLKTMLPSLLGGLAGGAIGGAIGGAVGAGGSSYPNSTGEGQKYEDLSSFNDRGSRNVNPGNVKGTGYLGQIGQDDKGHAVFATKEAGVAGIVDRLHRYNQEKVPGDGLSGKRTIRDIMNVYAPASDGNNTEQYIASISRKLGISPDQQIDFKKNPELLKPFVQMIMKNESPGAKAYSEDEVNRGIEIGSSRALNGKEATAEKYAAYLKPSDTPGRRAAETLVAGASGDLNKDLFNATKDASGTRYGYGSKDLTRGAIDCSGWVHSAMRKAGAPQNVIEELVGKNAASQVIDTGRKTNTLQASNNVGGMKEGQLIGVRNNAGREGSIGHVGIVVRNPDTGELGVSHSSSSKGVTWQPIASFQKDFGKYGFVTSDPLVASRKLAEDKKEEEAVQSSTPPAKSEEIVAALSEPQGSTEQTPTEQSQGTDGTSAPTSVARAETQEPLQAPIPTPSTDNTQDVAKAEPKKALSFYDYLKEVKHLRLTREVDYGLGGRYEALDGEYHAYLAENNMRNPESSDEGIIAGSKEPDRQNGLVADTSRGQDAVQPVITIPANKRSVAPSVSPVRPSSTRPPLAENKSIPTTPPPIIIQQAQQEEKKDSATAGGQLPMRVNSQAVLAFQLDPTTPVYP